MVLCTTYKEEEADFISPRGKLVFTLTHINKHERSLLELYQMQELRSDQMGVWYLAQGHLTVLQKCPRTSLATTSSNSPQVVIAHK